MGMENLSKLSNNSSEIHLQTKTLQGMIASWKNKKFAENHHFFSKLAGKITYL